MFSRRTAWNLTPSRFALAIDARRQSGAELLDLSESNPTHCGFRYHEEEIRRALASKDALLYTPDPRGLRSAREAIATYYRSRGSPADVPVDNIFITTSTSEGYSYLFRLLCDAGDEVLVPAPSYPLFEYLAGLNDIRLAPYALVYDHGWQIDLHSVDSAVTPRTRALMLVHPNNPTGSFVKANEREKIAAVCAQADLAIVADEVFLDYAHDGVARPSFATSSTALTFTLSGLSKIAGVPQMKAAWIGVSGPDGLVREATARLEVIADTYLSINAPVQHALPVLLEQGRSIQEQISARVAADLQSLDVQLASQRLVTRLDVEGGWYAVLRVPVTRSDEDLAIVLLEQRGVLVHPGHFYDFDRDGFLVVSLITPEAAFRTGIERLLAFLLQATEH
jgi:alanine-synthesizing transaminase